jgi:hypothetical protein
MMGSLSGMVPHSKPVQAPVTKHWERKKTAFSGLVEFTQLYLLLFIGRLYGHN